MNFLAHLFLSEPSPGFIVGSIAADFLGPDWRSSDPDVLAGIARHQEVDQLTDEHPLFKQSCQRLRGRLRHGRGVAVDVFYDHFLALHWARFSQEPFEDFVSRMHQTLQAHQQLCPPVMQRVLPRFIAEDWLRSYGSLEGIREALVRLTRRVKGRIDFASVADDLGTEYGSFEADFLKFFPQLCTASCATRSACPWEE